MSLHDSMKDKTWIFLSVLVALMTTVVVAGVHALYAGLEPSADEPVDILPVYSDDQLTALMQDDDVDYSFPTASGVDKADTKTEPAPKAEPVTKEEPKAEPAKAAPKAQTATKEEAKPAAKKKPIEFKVTNFRTRKKNTLSQNPDTYKLQLIDHTGKSMWTVSLSGPIVGPVAEVDNLYAGKIQFMVAVGDKLHIFDLKGNELKGYPKTAKGIITKGPVKTTKDNVSCFKVETDKGTVYYNTKTGKFM